MNPKCATSPAELKELLRKAAAELGFEAFGVTSAEASERGEYFRRWIDEGRNGNMAWMARDIDRRIFPQHVLPEARSLVCVGMNYWQPQKARRGKIATYALGGDYHKLITNRLKKLCDILREYEGANRPYVDTGPLLEKPLCARAGLGWQGRHTGLVHQRFGGWLFLGVVITTLELPRDEPHANHCGSCSRCLGACPTHALTASNQMDARRCISYLTIEHKGSIPVEMRPLIGDHLYGCEECIAACPWNRHTKTTKEERFAPRNIPDLLDILAWDGEAFDSATAGMAMRRTGLENMKRNACVVLGNIGTMEDLPALRTCASDSSSIIAEHATWAVEQIITRMSASTSVKAESVEP